MRPGYRRRVQRALEYIGRNLDRPIRVADVAKAAAFSEHHFHRIFRATMDETVGQYITRTRLEAAALMLAYRRDLSVTRIGYACGYSSTSNFSKAFSAFFGVSPSAVRRQETDAPAKLGTLKQRYGKDFAVADLFVLPDAGPKVTDVAAMRFEQIPGFPVACMMGEAGYDVAATMRLWEELIARAQQLELCGEDVDAWAIVHDDPAMTAAGRCRYQACIRLASAAPSLPAPLFPGEIPSGRYAVFPHRGPARDVSRTYRAIYAGWFPDSSLAPDVLPPLEHYINDEPDADGNIDMEILIRVVPLAD